MEDEHAVLNITTKYSYCWSTGHYWVHNLTRALMFVAALGSLFKCINEAEWSNCHGLLVLHMLVCLSERLCSIGQVFSQSTVSEVYVCVCVCVCVGGGEAFIPLRKFSCDLMTKYTRFSTCSSLRFVLALTAASSQNVGNFPRLASGKHINR